MFCPSCGLEEKQSNQFCRACGTDLRSVRTALERPDNITSSAVSAREEIGRAIAAKIRETKSTNELKKVAEQVLPQIEKFLESPEQRRLRRLRAGVVMSSIGIGVALMFLLMISNGADAIFMVGAGLITFFIGLGIIINGLLFTLPPKSVADNSLDARSQRELDVADAQPNELLMPKQSDDGVSSSVTEHTTHRLKEKQPIPRA
ncbi:MAG: zinc ribbon domain-containing protein [Acidobacteria bacterium]|nr:zinc ribbon domain-containing protein [Acidobacteriota bacterium]